MNTLHRLIPFKFLFILSLSIAVISPIKAQDTLRVLSYNLLNYGNITDYCTLANNSFIDKEKPLSRIVQYINPDIFGVCELSSNTFVHQRLLDSALNKNGIKHYAKASYINTSGSDLVSMLYYNDQKLALKSQYVLNNSVRDIILYKLYYLSPDLQQTHDTAFINCIVSHLKAGSTSADRDSRALMTLNAMNWIENQGGPGNYLFMGDFNIQSNTEQSYQNLLNYPITSIRFFDPINQSGNWNNNSSFSNIHTQSTHLTSNGCASTGGMDDRFDFILASAKVMNGSNHFQYITNSYKAVGNDGNHYNQSINSGSNNSVPPQILSDLFNMSDHLPIVLDIKIDQIGAGFTPKRDEKIWLSVVNPFDQNLEIEIKSTEFFLSDLEIYNSIGKKIFGLQMAKKTSQFRETISTTNWSSGVYILIVRDENGNKSTKKIIKR